MSKFDIAGVMVEITSDKEFLFNKFTSFCSSELKKADLDVKVNSYEFIQKPGSKMFADEQIKWCDYSSEDNTFIAFNYEEESDQVRYMIKADSKWSTATMSYLKDDTNPEFGITGFLGEILFRNHILFHDGLVIHAAAVELDGKGILFSAPSETGKSTQANLWRLNKGANVLNGDRPAVRMINDKPYVYGTPWSGSSPDFINRKAQLAAIVILEQAPENSICCLEKNEAVIRLMPRCFLPYYSSSLMDKAISNVDKIVNSTPVYLLKCRPDNEAVELVYQCIK